MKKFKKVVNDKDYEIVKNYLNKEYMKYAVHCDFWEFILSLENIEFLCEDFLKAKKNIFEKDSVSINTDYTEIIISETKQILEIIYKYYNDDGSFKY